MVLLKIQRLKENVIEPRKGFKMDLEKLICTTCVRTRGLNEFCPDPMPDEGETCEAYREADWSKIEQLRAENEHLCNTVDATRQDIADYMDGSKENQLKADLKKYGRHLDSCLIVIDESYEKSVSCTDVYCDCGYEQALNAQEPPSASA